MMRRITKHAVGLTAVMLSVVLVCVMASSAFADTMPSDLKTLPLADTGLALVTDSDLGTGEVLPEPDVRYGSAIVMDADTGAVYYEHNAYMQRPMASTTKIMTCLLAIEAGDLGRIITITEEMLEYDEEGSTKLGLQLGDNITMHDLLVGMMLLSGNDCAQAVAVTLGGSLDGFASMMNERASEIGMFDTHFITPSGLDDENHYSTAYDMALLGAEAMKNEDFVSISSMKSYTIQFGNPMTDYPLSAHNYLLEGLSRSVDGCNGIKTGYTSTAYYCLISHVERSGVRLVCATLGMPSYWMYHEELYDYAFSEYVELSAQPVLPEDQVTVIGGASPTVGVACEVENGGFAVHRNQTDHITGTVTMNKFEYAPITEGQVLGYVTYYYGTAELATFPIKATENVECVTSDWLSAYLEAIKYNMDT